MGEECVKDDLLGRQYGEVEQDSTNEQERELRLKWDLHCITDEDIENQLRAGEGMA